MKKLKLTNGGYALVDDEDFERISEFKWLWIQFPNSRTKYVIRTTNKTNTKYGQRVWLHRFITNTNDVTDHVNGDGLDNRRSNLRVANYSQNGANRDKQRNNTSGYKGVFLERTTGKWFTQIRVLGKSYRFGVYLNKEEAAHQYDCVAEQIFGDFARVNGV